ncbi:hypothetical protein FRC04_002925 [Tulasnella sp. 424]|nr:hypothetical protein FRC04_002925 [Tulasnella sp. 424]
MNSRTAARRFALSSRTAARQSVPRHGGVRYNASTALQLVVGGGVVLAGGYGYYHFSGTRALVQTSQSVQSILKSAKDSAFEKAPAPNEVIQFLRSTTKSYASFFPGASSYVDASFDAIDRLEQTHRKKVDAIVKQIYDELREITKNGGVDAQTAQKIGEAKKKGGPHFDAAWSAAQGWLESVPGGEKALETAKDPTNQKHFLWKKGDGVFFSFLSKREDDLWAAVKTQGSCSHWPKQGASSPTSPSASQQMSPLVAAVIGGGVVLVGVYGYSHFSGTHAFVQTPHPVQSTIKPAKDTPLDKTLPPNEIIQLLRSTVKSYIFFIPGASAFVDASFDTIDRLEQTHREEVDAIVKRTYAELLEVTKNGRVDAPTAVKVLDVLKRLTAELAEVAQKAAKHPEVTEKLGGAWTDIQRTFQSLKDADLAQQAERIFHDTSSQLVRIIKSHIDEEAQQILELSRKAAKELYEKGQEEYLKNAPEELKKFFSDDETVKGLLGTGAGTARVVAVWAKVKEVGQKGRWDDKSVREVKDFVQRKIEEAKDQRKGGERKDGQKGGEKGERGRQ